MQKKTETVFGKKFLWGAATSAHQVEGNTRNQWSVWELEHDKSLAAQAQYHFDDLRSWPDIRTVAKQPGNYLSGMSTDHHSRYEKDFDLLRTLNLTAYRFSIEWSRIEPNEGGWDAEAIEYYKRYIAALKRRGIEPMVTLFHFTLPVWFVEKGGFEKRANVKYFIRFAEKILTELGGSVRYIITINEPEVYAVQSYYKAEWPPARQSKWQMFKVLRNLIYCHNKTAKMIHGLNRRYRVSIAKNSAYIYPGDDAWLSRFSARIAQYVQDDYVLKRVKKTCDFIGVNYYFSARIYGYRAHNDDRKVNDLGWNMEPEHLEFVLKRLHDSYKLPLIVTENGLADMHDTDRRWWLGKTMLALRNALEAGVDVKGYFHWSLLDNFEWAYGKWPRFGLVEVNYETFERTIRPSARWWGNLLAAIQKEKKS